MSDQILDKIEEMRDGENFSESSRIEIVRVKIGGYPCDGDYETYDPVSKAVTRHRFTPFRAGILAMSAWDGKNLPNGDVIDERGSIVK